MNPIAIIATSVVLAAGAGAMAALLVNESAATQNSSLDHSGVDLTSELQREGARIDALESELSQLRKRVDRTIATSLATLREDMVSADDLAAVRAELEALRGGMGGGNDAAADIPLPLPAKEAVASYIEQQIEKASEDLDRKTRRRQFERAKPFVKMGMMRQVNRLKKRLNLNDAQTERMKKSFDETFEKVFPRFGVIMDPEAPAEEREVAVAEVQDAMKEVENDAQSYLDPTQYQQFQQIQQEQTNGFTSFLQNIGSMMNPPGGQQSPPAGSDG